MEPARPVLTRWLLRAMPAACFALAAALAVRQAGSLDIGFHLKAGEQILSAGGWPGLDTFTYTLNDRPYVDTSWGYQVLLSLVRRWQGAAGVVLFHAGLVLAAFFVVWRSARLEPADPCTLGLVLSAAVVASELRFEARPELISWLLLAATLHVLRRRALGRASPLWLLPVAHGLWANLHSFFVLGWIATGCFVLGLRLRDGRLDRRLLGWGLASVAATLVNPYGWRGALFPFTLATRFQEGNVFGQSIGEFVSPFRLGLSQEYPFSPSLAIGAFRVLALVCVAALIPLVRRRRYAEALVLLPFLALSCRMIRNMPLLAVAGAPLAIQALPLRPALQAILRRRDGLVRVAERLLAAGCVAGCLLLGLRVIQDAYYIDSRRLERFGLGWNRLALPIDAAGYADRVGLDSPMLNHLNFGGWLMWARPQPVFIDGRLEVTGESFFEAYRQALASEAALEAVVARHRIGWIIFPYVTSPALLGRLSRDSRWRLAYHDHLAAIFVRAGEGSTAYVDSSPTSPAAPAPLQRLVGLSGHPRRPRAARWLDGFVRRQQFPLEDYNRGLFHYFRGEMLPAERRFASAVAVSGGAYYEIYNNLGAALFHQKRLKEAAECYRVVLQDDPGNRIARERLASSDARR